MTSADLTWNRACMERGGDEPRIGDLALAGMLLFHGLAMNGEVRHALECLTPAEHAAGNRPSMDGLRSCSLPP